MLTEPVAPPTTSDLYWSAIAEYRLDDALSLSDALLADTIGADRIWWMYLRGALHRLRAEMLQSSDWLQRAASELHTFAADWPVALSLCSGLAMHLSLVGQSREALEVLNEAPEGGHTSTEEWRVLKRRLEWGAQASERLQGVDCLIVPIGQECLPYDLSLRWGLGRQLVEGPFTAGVFFGDGPMKAIEDGFEHFLQASSYKVVLTKSGIEAPTISTYGAILNHERGPYWLSDGLPNVMALYRRRVQNFKEAMQAERVLFVMDRRYPANTEALLRTLEVARDGKPFGLFVVRTDGGPDDAGTLDPRVTQARIDRPGGDYVWWEPSSYNTELGYAYELEITKPLLAALQGAGGTTW